MSEVYDNANDIDERIYPMLLVEDVSDSREAWEEWRTLHLEARLTAFGRSQGRGLQRLKNRWLSQVGEYGVESNVHVSIDHSTCGQSHLYTSCSFGGMLIARCSV